MIGVGKHSTFLLLLDDIVAQVNPPATILGETAIAVAAPAATEATTGEEASGIRNLSIY